MTDKKYNRQFTITQFLLHKLDYFIGTLGLRKTILSSKHLTQSREPTESSQASHGD